MQKRIVTLTINPALDKITGITHVVPNQKLRCNQPKFEAGGGGINVSRAIRKLGGESLAIFPSGGNNGDILQEKLQIENIPFQTVAIKNHTRENFTVFESSTNQQFRFIMPGPRIAEEELARLLTSLDDLQPKPDYLVISGSMPDSLSEVYIEQLIDFCDGIGCRVVVDTSGKHLKRAANMGVYLLKPNMRELGTLAGNSIEGETSQIEAAEDVINSGQAEVVVVSLGAGGALLVTSDKSEQLRTPTVTIRSKLGAGDSMVAGMVLKLAQGENLHNAIQYGLAAGAATVSTEGTELCSKSDTDQLYERLQQSNL